MAAAAKKKRGGLQHPVSSKQRKKIIRKLLRSVRVAAAPHFAEIARETGLHERTIRKIYNHFMQGLPWGDVGRPTDPKHDARLVARQIEELKAHYAAEQRAKGGVGTLSNRSCAKLLDIKWGTFARILKKIATLRSTDITFSRDPNFLKKLLRHIRLALYSVLATMSSLAHPSVTGALIDMFRKGRKVIVLADQKMLLSKYSRPRIEELMKAGISVYYQKQVSRDQHQNVIIVDDVAVSVGSADASLKAADFDFENIVYLYSEDDVGVFKQEFDLELEGDCALLTPDWLDAHPPKEEGPEEYGSERVLPEDSSLVP